MENKAKCFSIELNSPHVGRSWFQCGANIFKDRFDTFFLLITVHQIVRVKARKALQDQKGLQHLSTEKTRNIFQNGVA